MFVSIPSSQNSVTARNFSGFVSANKMLTACTRDRLTRKESRGIQQEGTCLGMAIVPSKVLTALELGTCRLMATTTTTPTGTETRS